MNYVSQNSNNSGAAYTYKIYQTEAYSNSCEDCTGKLASGQYDIVRLGKNIVDYGGAFIYLHMGESNVVFDCLGHTIDGDDLAVNTAPAALVKIIIIALMIVLILIMMAYPVTRITARPCPTRTRWIKTETGSVMYAIPMMTMTV